MYYSYGRNFGFNFRKEHISYYGKAQLVWQEMGFVLDFVEAGVSFSPSLPN